MSGVIPVSSLERLGEVVQGSEGVVQVELVFAISDEGKKVMTGSASADLSLVCQRCLGPVVVPVTCDIALAVVWTEEEAKGLPVHLDPWIVGEDPAEFHDIIEEELLLNLPTVAYHEALCIDEKLLSRGEPVVAEKEENPFHILEQLKGSPKSDQH